MVSFKHHVERVLNCHLANLPSGLFFGVQRMLSILEWILSFRTNDEPHHGVQPEREEKAVIGANLTASRHESASQYDLPKRR